MISLSFQQKQKPLSFGQTQQNNYFWNNSLFAGRKTLVEKSSICVRMTEKIPVVEDFFLHILNRTYLYLSCCSSDGAARIFIPNSCAAAGFRTHVRRVAPAWDLSDPLATELQRRCQLLKIAIVQCQIDSKVPVGSCSICINVKGPMSN